MAGTASLTGGLRVLIACESCNRQYDTSNFKAGTRFHCICSTVVTVQTVRARDVTVVRFSSCGAVRQEKAEACLYCGSALTLFEQDLHTVCPQCMTRTSDRAKFCHFCATPIAPQGSAGDHTDFACPICSILMHRRNYGRKSGVLVDTCKAHGIWFDFGELETILHWIKSGRLARAQQLESKRLYSQKRLKQGVR